MAICPSSCTLSGDLAAQLLLGLALFFCRGQGCDLRPQGFKFATFGSGSEGIRRRGAERLGSVSRACFRAVLPLEKEFTIRLGSDPANALDKAWLGILVSCYIISVLSGPSCLLSVAVICRLLGT